MKCYILDNHTPVEATMNDWIDWQSNHKVHIALDNVVLDEPITISTMFFGINLSFDPERLELFETVVFGGEYDERKWRYLSWDDAVNGHNDVVRKIVKSYYKDKSDEELESMITTKRVAGKLSA